MVSAPTTYLADVWGSSSTDVWAVESGDGEVYHYDGSTWSKVATASNSLYDVWCSAPDNVWAVGYDDIILRYDGTTWTERTLESGWELAGVHGTSSENVFICGETGYLLQYNRE
jgi:photosystem II stability/assembly factor-like uncharacterized protein